MILVWPSTGAPLQIALLDCLPVGSQSSGLPIGHVRDPTW